MSLPSQANFIFRRLVRPKKWFLATFYISLGGFLNGYDTGSIGSITVMPAFESSVATLSPLARGFTVSLLLLTATFSSLFSGLLADRFGHLPIMLTGALVFTIGAAIEAGSPNLAALLVGRALAGIGEGLYLANLSVYICEIAPRRKRGMMGSTPQAFVSLGAAAGYFTCYGTARIAGDWQWRLPFVIQVFIGAAFAIACCLLPKSPRWLIARNQREAAQANMKRLDFEQEDILLDLFTRDTEVSQSEQQPSLSSRDIMNVFSKQYRFRTGLALFILGMIQLSGIDGVLFYAPILFTQAGLPADTASFVASGVSAILMFAISIPAFLLADYWGRRAIVFVGGAILATTMLVVGSIYASGSAAAGRWAVIVSIFVFALTYVSTWAIVGKLYATEIQPAHSRATVNALAQALNWFTNFLTAFITPVFLARSPAGPYFLFAGFTILTLVVLFLYMPETRGRSLESIQEMFHPPIEKFVSKTKTRLSARTSHAAAVGANGPLRSVDPRVE
ncbi:general substrate transporter [Nemania sp. FL0916]|nr:general substrate transporter [Nemania sp. FL0916]